MSDSRSLHIHIAKLCLLAIAMFAFVFVVMVPLYNLFCEVTGLNGKTKGRYEAVEVRVDESRQVKVQMVAMHNEGMPWIFKPEKTEVLVHPGESIQVNYFVQNPTGNDMVAQAVPSILPGTVSQYFHKTECFCFNQQTLKAGESLSMPLVFIVDPDLPKQVKTITLSYTIFDVSPDRRMRSASL